MISAYANSGIALSVIYCGAAKCPELGCRLHHPRSRSAAFGLWPTFIPDTISVPERVAVHAIDNRAQHRSRGAQGGYQHPSCWLSTIPRVLQESLCMRLQRRQTRFQELPASEICSFSLEDALCGTHLLSQVLSVNLLHPNKANDHQPVPIRPDCRPTEGQRFFLSHPTH